MPFPFWSPLKQLNKGTTLPRLSIVTLLNLFLAISPNALFAFLKTRLPNLYTKSVSLQERLFSRVRKP
jgi:hypothetical protein